MKLKDMRIGTRLGIGFGILAVLMAVLVITGISATSKMNDKLKQIVEVNNAKIEAAFTMKDGVQLVNLATFGKLVSKDAAFQEQNAKIIDSSRAEYKASVDKIEKIEKSEKGKELIQQIKSNISSGRENNTKALEASKAGNTEEAVNIFLGTVLPASLKLFDNCQELVKYQQASTAASFAEAQSSYRSTIMLLVVLGIFVVAFTIFSTLVLTRSITEPIGRNVRAAQMLAEGKLGVELTVDRSDEFGQETSALKGMVEKWRQIILDIKQAADNVAAASTQLSAGADQMSRGANDQAGRSHQVATASQEMSQTVLDVASNASNIATTANGAAATAKDGGTIVEEAVKEVREIALTVEESSDHITSLAELSKRIGEIIGIINEIADQTNLLALNAAIEAARAGEHGRGFAVVADEVRKLAERTTGATSEVSGIIKEIQNKVDSAVSSIEKVSTKVDRGVDLSSRAGVELKNIVGSVEDLQMMVQQIATAIEEMSATSDQISKDIESISGISVETSQSSNEVSRASLELSKLGTGLQSIANQFEI
jgi:methyl-accepting chemotaxis protein